MSQPNVLVYVSHDTGRHISPYGVKTVTTPAAERVAREGVVFERCFCTAPQCSPSRAGLFTGRYPHANGVMGLTHADFAWDLNDSEVHAVGHFAKLGYATCLVGIAHEVREPGSIGHEFIRYENRARLAPGAFEEFLDALAPGRPFFAEIGVFETHRPYDFDEAKPDDSLGLTVPDYLDPTPGTRAEFAALQGSVRRWDEGLGALLDALDKRGLADDTILVVTTDHGLAMPRAKCTLYDAGIAVLLMLRWPGRLEAGTRRAEMVSNVDVLPTLLEAVGAEVPDAMQGRSVWPLLAGTDYAPREEIFAEMTFHQYYDPMRCVRTDRWKYIRNFEMAPGVHVPGDIMPAPAFLENAERVLSPRHHPFEELYDLSADAGEQNNLAGEEAHVAVRGDLSAKLTDWMRRTNDPLLEGPIASPYYHHSVSEAAS